MADLPRRVFLGWDRAPLEAIADWLSSEHGKSMGGLLIALPGARAARRLLIELSRRHGPDWSPPDVCTLGQAGDALLELSGRRASRLVRTLAWERALRGLAPAQLAGLVAHSPAPEDHAGWSRLAEEVRTLFGELAAEGLDFRGVVAAEALRGIEGEQARWAALAAVQELMIRELDAVGLVDPHLERLEALEQGRVRADRQVVLAGIVEMNALQRRTLERLAGNVTSLVLAPEECADRFGSLGELNADDWCEQDVDLPAGCWQVVATPDDQAAAVSDWLAGLGGRFAPEQVSIGVADSEVTPYLERRLLDAGISTRDAAGSPLSRTLPARLLEAVAEYLASRSFASLAALVRHPDLEELLRTTPGLEQIDLATLLDEHLQKHIPVRAEGRWPDASNRRVELDAVHTGLADRLGELAGEQRLPPSGWAGPIRDWLVTVYGDRSLEVGPGQDGAVHDLVCGLSGIGALLAEFEQLPEPLLREVGAAEAMAWLARLLRAEVVPPRSPAPGKPVIELLGWLELVLDDAPVLACTGFNEGKVPAAVRGESWLPDSVRARLGLEDDRRRLARDLFAVTVLLNSRESCCFVSGRRSGDGDPLLPSRIAFHAPEEEIPARVGRVLLAAGAGRTSVIDGTAPQRRLPRREPYRPPREFAVTSFRTYLQSPYLFYLQRILRLKTFDHDGRELDPLGFGNLAHETLEVLATPELAAEVDPERLASALDRALVHRARRQFGPDPALAVSLQIEQLGWRLREFATTQAERARQGWRILHAEWTPSAPVQLLVDDEPAGLVGRIDRIDVHEDGRIALLDYKSGEGSRDPDKTHRRKGGEWLDLQLPLYAVLAAELLDGQVPVLGYVNLGKDETKIQFREMLCQQADLEAARAEAVRIIRDVRAGKLFEAGSGAPDTPVLKALFGQDLLVPGTEVEA